MVFELVVLEESFLQDVKASIIHAEKNKSFFI